jgi:hypothetical protein
VRKREREREKWRGVEGREGGERERKRDDSSSNTFLLTFFYLHWE